METLLLFAHGSRKDIASQEVCDHAASGLETFVPAFLEFAQPDIGTDVDHCVKRGAKKITVVPYIKPD